MGFEKFTYKVREEITADNVRYFAAFVDDTGAKCEAEISLEMFLALEECRLDEKRQLNVFDRHIERLKLSEEQLAARQAHPQASLDETVAQRVDVQAALDTLTITQRRRLLLYHEHGLSLIEIAQIEKRSTAAITESIAIATAKLKNFFE